MTRKAMGNLTYEGESKHQNIYFDNLILLPRISTSGVFPRITWGRLTRYDLVTALIWTGMEEYLAVAKIFH